MAHPVSSGFWVCFFLLIYLKFLHRIVNHYFYRITNKINGKYYLGVRSYSGDPEKDYYMGSGPVIRAAIRKYGKQNFTREVIKLFSSQEEAYNYEREHVTLKEVLDPQCYNVQLGGLGGTRGAVFLQKGEKVVRVLPEMREQLEKQGFVQYRKQHSESTLDKMRKSHLGKRNSQESINQMKAKIKAMIWIYRGTEESRILKKDLKSRELEGWKIGRNPESRSKISNSLKTFNKKKRVAKNKPIY